jgi:hypothetical protein
MVPTSAAVLSVLLSPFDEAEELVAGEDEACVAESWALLFVVVALLLLLPLPLPLPVLVLVEGEFVVSEGIVAEYVIAVGNEIDVPDTSRTQSAPASHFRPHLSRWVRNELTCGCATLTICNKILRIYSCWAPICIAIGNMLFSG